MREGKNFFQKVFPSRTFTLLQNSNAFGAPLGAECAVFGPRDGIGGGDEGRADDAGGGAEQEVVAAVVVVVGNVLDFGVEGADAEETADLAGQPLLARLTLQISA